MIRDLSWTEQSVLLYLETCAVDQAGMVEAVRMNSEEFDIIDRWKQTGFVKFSRLPADYVMKQKGRRDQKTHIVALSQDAWETVQAYRRGRADRMLDTSQFKELVS